MPASRSMPRIITKNSDGYGLEDLETGTKVGGPYRTYGESSDANLALGDKPERAQAKMEASDALKPANLKTEIARANETPTVLASRGRPVSDNQIPYRIALEAHYLASSTASEPPQRIITQAWLEATARKNPEKAADLFLRALEYHVPKLARTETTVEGELTVATRLVIKRPGDA